MLEIKDGKKILTTPVSAEDLKDIHAGDIIYLNGSMTTCRDVAHRRLVEEGRELPVDVKDAAIFHAGPIIRPLENDKFEMVSVGPTTSMRMEKFEYEFVKESGVRVIIGKGGSGIERLKASLKNIIAEKNVLINIVEVKNAETNAQLMAENIAAQLEKRISFRRAMKQTIQRAMKAGTLGVKTACSGRLGGAEIARTEQYNEGTIPLQTIRADIDYGFAEADTTYGKIGVKVWVYNGEVLPTKKVEKKEEANA